MLDYNQRSITVHHFPTLPTWARGVEMVQYLLLVGGPMDKYCSVWVVWLHMVPLNPTVMIMGGNTTHPC